MYVIGAVYDKCRLSVIPRALLIILHVIRGDAELSVVGFFFSLNKCYFTDHFYHLYFTLVKSDLSPYTRNTSSKISLIIICTIYYNVELQTIPTAN